MNLLRKILLPIVPFYYFVTWLRNKMYDFGIKKSNTYSFPIIAVGNLSVGGTGKSPMIEYLIRLLNDKKRLATLSRGYKRETKGFQVVTASATAKEVGDEPLQFKRKFSDIIVAVDADRSNGIANLRSLNPKPEVILLDDAYQHRKVKAGFYILLTAYYDLYCDDIVLPTGNLRESRKGANRANIIVVTKCPDNLSLNERKKIISKLALKSNQYLFFTSIAYSKNIVSMSETKSIHAIQNKSFTLVTGIANPTPLINYYTALELEFKHIDFPDHHSFTTKELEDLKTHEFIITTEKDYVRLSSHIPKDKLWYQPIKVNFIQDADIFDDKLLEYVKRDLS